MKKRGHHDPCSGTCSSSEADFSPGNPEGPTGQPGDEPAVVVAEAAWQAVAPVPLDVQHLQLLHLATALCHQAASDGGCSTGSPTAGSGSSRLFSPEMVTLLPNLLTTARVAWLKNEQVFDLLSHYQSRYCLRTAAGAHLHPPTSMYYYEVVLCAEATVVKSMMDT